MTDHDQDFDRSRDGGAGRLPWRPDLDGPDLGGPDPDGNGTDVGAVYFQPGCEADLKRFPPQNVTCRRIRCLLRDYTDADLTDTLVQEVDDHVHGCRDCGLALSRSELEVFQLRQALTEDVEPAQEVPAQFTSQVMQEVAGLALAEQDAPSDFTSRVMDQVRREWDEPSVWHRLRLRAASHSGVVLTAAALILVALFVVSWRSDEDAVTITDAQGGQMVMGERSEAIRGGDIWPSASTILLEEADRIAVDYPLSGRVLASRSEEPLARTGANGTGAEGAGLRYAKIDVYGPARLVRPASDLSPDSSVLAAADEFVMHGGVLDLAIDSDSGDFRPNSSASSGRKADLGPSRSGEERDPGRRYRFDQDACFSFRIDETCRLAFAAGRYSVSVESVRRSDVPSMERVLRVRLEVIRGRAWIMRGVLERDVVAIGTDWVAHFDAWSPVLKEQSFEAILRSAGDPTENRVAVDPNRIAEYSWHGKVVDEFAFKAVAQAIVRIVPEFGEAFEVRTDDRGEYEFTSLDAHGKLALVEVRPVSPINQGSRGIRWAAFGPRPITVTEQKPGFLEVAVVVLVRNVRIEGRVMSALGGLGDARVVPCVVDNILGLVDPLEHLVARTDVHGNYQLDDMPLDLGPGQVLALVVEHDAHPTRAFLSLGRRNAPQLSAAYDLRVFDGQSLAVSDCDARKTVELLQVVPGLPLRAFATKFQAVTNDLGVAEFRGVGPGQCWLVDRDASLVTPLLFRVGADGRRVGTRGEPESLDRWPFQRWLSGSSRVSAGRVRYSAGSRRYGKVGYAGTGVFHDLAVNEELDSVLLAARVRLFLLLGNGEVRFLGHYDGVSPFEFEEPVERPYSLYAVDADGKIGVLASSEFSKDGPLSIVIGEGGTIDLASHLRPLPGGEPRLLGFEMLDGPRRGEMVWRLFEAGSNWSISGMMPGLYALRLPDGRSVEVRIHPGGSWSSGEGSGDPGAVDPGQRSPGGAKTGGGGATRGK